MADRIDFVFSLESSVEESVDILRRRKQNNGKKKKKGAKITADQFCSDTILRSRENKRRNWKSRDWNKNRGKSKSHFIISCIEVAPENTIYRKANKLVVV